MAFLGSATCARCGASIASGVARCPFCGTSAAETNGSNKESGGKRDAGASSFAPAAPLLSTDASPRPRPSFAVRKATPKWVVPGAAAGIVLAGAVAISLLGEKRSGVATLASSTSTPASSVVIAARAEKGFYADPTRVDASDLYPRVKQRAVAWNADAHLLSIAANPVVGDKVDLTQDEAEIVYVFGADTSARTPPFGQIAIAARRGGLEQSPVIERSKTATAGAKTPAPVAQHVVEPNCVFDAAAKAAHASGVPVGIVMKMRYEGDTKLGRGVWTARVPGRGDLERVIDGQNCAIVVRR